MPKSHWFLALGLCAGLTSTQSILAETNLEHAPLITEHYSFEELSNLDLDLYRLVPIESIASSSCDLKDKSSSKKNVLFNRAVGKMLDLDHLENHISLPGQDFLLHNSTGQRVTRFAQLGDLLEISLTADPTGRSYWVKIEKINRSSQQLSIVVRPTASPKLKKKAGVTDHFFTNAATNTFSVTMTNTKLIARVHGQNEIVNTTQVRSWTDKAANTAIATMAWGVYYDGKALAGLQSYTWNSLASHLANCN